MCIPATINDLDFSDTALEGEEARRYVETYARRVLDEAWRMDCYATEGTSMGNSRRFQECALRVLRAKLGDGIAILRLPPVRSAAHHAGRRVRPFKGGM